MSNRATAHSIDQRHCFTQCRAKPAELKDRSADGLCVPVVNKSHDETRTDRSCTHVVPQAQILAPNLFSVYMPGSSSNPGNVCNRILIVSPSRVSGSVERLSEVVRSVLLLLIRTSSTLKCLVQI